MFEVLPLLPNDPILGLSIAYANDTNPQKVDLGVGVYKNDAGVTPIMKAVAEAEKLRIQRDTTKAYTPPAGVPGANEVSTRLVFGAVHAAVEAGRVRTVQAPGGCGALRVAAELIQRAKPGANLWVSTPTWANHIPLLGSAGLKLREYPYYDYASHSIDFVAMMATINEIPRGDLVLLHACCHNPSGADLTRAQWDQVADVLVERGIIPFVDMAYQGFGEGLEEDAYGLRMLANRVPEMIVANSFSKNFGLYRERAASLSLVFADTQQADAGFSQLLNVARGIYSMPPAHGSTIVDIILHSDELTQMWQSELTQMRQRIAGLRSHLVESLNGLQQARDFSFIAQERGMFSFLGLTVEQVRKLKSDYSIYMTDTSRISVAGLTTEKMDYVAKAIVAVL
ncbi:amino acid aminotransferase [Cellvibrio sp. pealriver]|uniref:amino acid aminotransferase n=1 Tax=Cellvibrio sp. pealriver TaxID=1622269 RepID=UPI00066FD365|nr:amino acid aminotransferase [Cellvibrio sp. pealriver]